MSIIQRRVECVVDYTDLPRSIQEYADEFALAHGFTEDERFTFDMMIDHYLENFATHAVNHIQEFLQTNLLTDQVFIDYSW